MSGPVAVLGVSAYYHDSAAALVVDGDVRAACQEERLTRVKGCADLPLQSIEYVLKEADLAPNDLAAVAFYESPFTKLDRILSSQVVGDPRALPRFVSAMRTWMPEKLWVESRLKAALGKRTTVLFGDHHLSHAASAFYPSPFQEAAVLTVDGVGEWSTTTVGRGEGSSLDLIEHVEYPNSLGLLYSAFTLYCGFRINSGEYKLMGLAPYGRPMFADRIREEMLHLDDDGSFSLNPAFFEYFRRDRTFGPRFEALLGQPARVEGQPLTAHFADVAASIQAVLDEAMLALAGRAVRTTGQRNLCLAGGVALNVVSAGAIERSGLVDRLWVQPAAGDAGGSLGAALWASHQVLGVPRVTPLPDGMHGALLGPTPTFDGTAVDSLLEEYGLAAVRMESDLLADAAADHLAAGRIVAVARGRMEFGPRALGSRSILADARDPGMQRRLNLATKLREGFRPFAPVVLSEDARAWFATDGRESPYMLKTYDVLPRHRVPCPTTSEDVFARAQEVRSVIPAVTHVDYSARVQTVDAHRFRFLHQVLTAFKARTGVPVLVNTSFNVRGEPIVCSAREAIEDFLACDIDVLIVDDWMVEKAAQVRVPAPRLPRPAGSD